MNQENPYQPPSPTPEPATERGIDATFGPDTEKALAGLGCFAFVVVFVAGVVSVLLIAAIDWVALRFLE
ncbi:hypothetical protein SH528x_004949 [Novipirellula sp. SH528]|uniref:hypothetical protein n=1 Tax=Novipirellula sp. SH528 TaxID=3454466 RepID=UPI003F9FA291